MVSLTTRPARAPPACIDVRPFRMMTMFLPSSASTFWLPRANPSPSADSSRNEITPQTMPNMVRNVRSLLARKFAHVWLRRSVMNSIASRLARGAEAAPAPIMTSAAVRYSLFH